MTEFKSDVLYTKSNEWAKNFGEIIRVGIDDYSQSSLGDIVHVEVADEGTHVVSGKSFGVIEAAKSVSDINSPVSGVIVRVNPKVKESPAILNIDPFGEGWIAEIKPENISVKTTELDTLMNADEYKRFIR